MCVVCACVLCVCMCGVCVCESVCGVCVWSHCQTFVCSPLSMFSCSRWAPILEFLRLALLVSADVVTTSTAINLHLTDTKTWVLRAILMVSISVWGYIVLFKVAGWKEKAKTK